MAKILLAASFAAKKHAGQKRKDGFEPYINHPLEVASILANIGEVTDEDILAAAILHDTLEDTETTEEEIKETFGEKVCNYVIEVSDDKTLKESERKRLQIERAHLLSPGAKQIKLADKISNIKDIMNSSPKNWSKQKKIDYIEWAKSVVERLRGTNEKLENYFDEVFQLAQRKIK
ncbi:MAG: HD domain-containing protein [Acidobacteriota bacterium]|nr:HD domain-containing protein [Acidobacteriota bacterium]